MADFGNKFRMARESKKLSFDDVSKVIKISARMLKAIEEEHFEQLPGGVFNKGFIRTYAKHLDMDDEQAVADYLACLHQAEADAAAAAEPQRPTRAPAAQKIRITEADRPPAKSRDSAEMEELPGLQLPRLQDIRPARRQFSERRGSPWKLAAFAAVVVVAGVFVWTRHSRSARPPSVHAAPPATSSSPAPTAPNDTSSPAFVNQPAVNQPKTAAPPAAAPTTNSPKPVRTTQVGPNPATLASSTETVAGDRPPATATSNLKPSEPASLTLVIRAAENSWISVLADGEPRIQETLIAPARTTIRANREISVRVGNAAAVSFVWNGQEIPADGAEAEVKSFTFDANGVHAPNSPPSSARIP